MILYKSGTLKYGQASLFFTAVNLHEVYGKLDWSHFQPDDLKAHMWQIQLQNYPFPRIK